LLADCSPPLSGLTLYYSDRHRVPPKLRAFIDFLQRHRNRLPPETQARILEV
jgi:DNA-binding transcriptional LysR family regulator